KLAVLKPDIVDPIAVIVIQQNLRISATLRFQKYVLVLVIKRMLGFGSLHEENILVRINRSVVQGAAIQNTSRFAMLSRFRIFQIIRQCQ
ncbi:MAG TPA: hypothetical protein VF831_01835, partial [Anaerolineales bacterium]